MEKRKKIAVMTGATSGFGKVIAHHLVQQNYELIFLARSEEKANRLIDALQKETHEATIEFIPCELSSFQSIAEACETIHKKCTHIDLLILNAGIWNFEFQESKDGIEETLQVNLLAPVLLFLKTKDLLPLNSGSKIIFSASGLHQGKIDYENLEFRNNFSGFKAYRQSKLGLILMTRLFAQLPEFSGLSFYSVHPGMVKTNLGDDANWLARTIFKLLGTSIEKGAQTHIHVINESSENLKSGEYYAKSKITKTTKEAYNLDEARKLWAKIKDYLQPILQNG